MADNVVFNELRD